MKITWEENLKCDKLPQVIYSIHRKKWESIFFAAVCKFISRYCRVFKQTLCKKDLNFEFLKSIIFHEPWIMVKVWTENKNLFLNVIFSKTSPSDGGRKKKQMVPYLRFIIITFFSPKYIHLVYFTIHSVVWIYSNR